MASASSLTSKTTRLIWLRRLPEERAQTASIRSIVRSCVTIHTSIIAKSSTKRGKETDAYNARTSRSSANAKSVPLMGNPWRIPATIGT